MSFWQSASNEEVVRGAIVVAVNSAGGEGPFKEMFAASDDSRFSDAATTHAGERASADLTATEIGELRDWLTALAATNDSRELHARQTLGIPQAQSAKIILAKGLVLVAAVAMARVERISAEGIRFYEGVPEIQSLSHLVQETVPDVVERFLGSHPSPEKASTVAAARFDNVKALLERELWPRDEARIVRDWLFEEFQNAVGDGSLPRFDDHRSCLNPEQFDRLEHHRTSGAVPTDLPEENGYVPDIAAKHAYQIGVALDWIQGDSFDVVISLFSDWKLDDQFVASIQAFADKRLGQDVKMRRNAFVRPQTLRIGDSVGPYSGPEGRLCCFVKCPRLQEDAQYLLMCGHTLASGTGTPSIGNTAIFSPPGTQPKRAQTSARVGEIAEFGLFPQDEAGDFFPDYALVKVDDRTLWSPRVAGKGALADVVALDPNAARNWLDVVRISSRSAPNQLLEGKVSDVDGIYPVIYDLLGEDVRYMRGVAVVASDADRPFSVEGSSGHLVLLHADDNLRKPVGVGMICAGSRSMNDDEVVLTFFQPLREMFDKLGLELA